SPATDISGEKSLFGGVRTREERGIGTKRTTAQFGDRDAHLSERREGGRGGGVAGQQVQGFRATSGTALRHRAARSGKQHLAIPRGQAARSPRRCPALRPAARAGPVCRKPGRNPRPPAAPPPEAVR